MGRAASDRISDFVYSPKPSSEFLQKVQSSQVTHTHTHQYLSSAPARQPRDHARTHLPPVGAWR